MKKVPFLKDERGAVLPIVVLFFAFVVFGISALVVDVGRLYTEKRVLVTAADAGALAGAKEMQKFLSTETQIRQAAIDAADYNGATDITVIIEMNSATSSVNDLKVEVIVKNTVDLFFAKAIGINTSDVRARAVAKPMRLNPGIFPIGISKDAAYENNKLKSGLFYLHYDKSDPSYFSDLLDLDGTSGNANDIPKMISTRTYEVGDQFASKLNSQGVIDTAGGWKTLKESISELFIAAKNYSTDVNKRQAYVTVLAPVYSSVVGKEAVIHEFAEIVILDMINPKPNQDAKGTKEAFPVTVSESGEVTVNYSNPVGNAVNIYPEQTVKNVDMVVVYFTGTTLTISDVLNGNYHGTLYENLKYNAVSLVE